MQKDKSSNLYNLIHTEQDARDFGFDWPNEMMALDQVMDECREIKEDIENKVPPDKLQEELGDLIHASISLCMYCGFDVEDTIKKSNHKFASRMESVKKITYEKGLENLQGQSIEFMMDIWKKAKQRNIK